jgi:hypothetical protein
MRDSCRKTLRPGRDRREAARVAPSSAHVPCAGLTRLMTALWLICAVRIELASQRGEPRPTLRTRLFYGTCRAGTPDEAAGTYPGGLTLALITPGSNDRRGYVYVPRDDLPASRLHPGGVS